MSTDLAVIDAEIIDAEIVADVAPVDSSGPYIEYVANNSGGYWWLSDDDWHALERTGWVVDWHANGGTGTWPGHVDAEGRWLGTLASRARLYRVTMDSAIESWETATGQDSQAEGCTCCGQPHGFYAYNVNGDMTW